MIVFIINNKFSSFNFNKYLSFNPLDNWTCLEKEYKSLVLKNIKKRDWFKTVDDVIFGYIAKKSFKRFGQNFSFFNSSTRKNYLLEANKMKYKGKYNLETVKEVLKLLENNITIREITKITSVPETTIRNWKYGYTDLYGTNKKLDNQLKEEIIFLLKEGGPIPEISKRLKLNYNLVRLFVKDILSPKEYSLIKSSNPSLPEESKSMTPDLAYIFGVMYGDGYFGKGQIRLGTKDKEFSDLFAKSVKNWCGKRAPQKVYWRNDKPYYECYLSFKQATEFIQDLIKERSSILDQIKQSNNFNIITSFIRGFSDSEGSIVKTKNGNILRFYNQKILILEEIKALMMKLGFDKNKLKVVLNKKIDSGDVYALRMCYKDQLKLFEQKIGFTINRKQKILQKCINKSETF